MLSFSNTVYEHRFLCFDVLTTYIDCCAPLLQYPMLVLVIASEEMDSLDAMSSDSSSSDEMSSSDSDSDEDDRKEPK